jgi:hypothetical protein
MEDQSKRVESWIAGSDEAVRETQAAILASGNKEAIAEWRGLSDEGRRAMVRRVGHQVGGHGYTHALAIWAGALAVLFLGMAMVPRAQTLLIIIFMAGGAYGLFVHYRQMWREVKPAPKPCPPKSKRNSLR